MRYALISDLHANLPALQAVHADITRRGIGAVYHLGDLVGYAPWPDEVVRLIAATGIPGAEVLPYVAAQCGGAVAASFGPAAVAGLWHAHWLYWVAPITGMMTAARAYETLRHAEPLPATPDIAPVGVQRPIQPS